MWRWVGCSRRPHGAGRRVGARRAGARRAALARLLALAGPALGLAPPAPASAQALLTQEEALELAFPPPATVERRTAFLDEAQVARAAELAGDAGVESGIVTYYVGRGKEGPIGYAYFDAHRVRTLDEVLMVVVSPEATVSRVEVLRFGEPREYLPPERWLDLFTGRELDDRLSTKGEIVNLTGATLTARAVTRAVRRVLALHETIHRGSRP